MPTSYTPEELNTDQSASDDAGELPGLTDRLIAYLQDAPTSEFRDERITLLDHWSGQDNLLWRVAVGDDESAHTPGRTAVVKLFLEAGQARGRRQLDGQSTFAELGIAPPPFWFDRYPHGLSRQVLVYQWVDGTPLELTDTDALTVLAQSVATVHLAEADTVRRFCPHPVNLDYFWRVEQGAAQQACRLSVQAELSEMAELLQPLIDRAREVVHAAIPLWHGVRPTPVHGDLRPDNAIHIPRGMAVLLDWEMYGLGDPARDVAQLLFHMQSQPSPRQAEIFLETYLGMVGEPGLKTRIQTYGKLLPLQSLVWLLNGTYTNVALSATAPVQSAEVTGQTSQETAEFVAALPFLRNAIEAAARTTALALDCRLSQSQLDQALSAWEITLAHRLSTPQ